MGESGIQAHSYCGFLLKEPWEIQTVGGTGYKVFTPFYNRLLEQNIRKPLPAPEAQSYPQGNLPASEDLASWQLLPHSPNWARGLEEAWEPGENAVYDRLELLIASAEQVNTVVRRIGGETGYFGWPLLWKLRGLMDKVSGGVGLRRGRRSRSQLSLGDVVDWWRVEALESNSLLRLRAEMRVPGQAWLEFKVSKIPEGKIELIQRAVFFPEGLLGRCYWWAVYPFHGLVFTGMIRNIIRQAEAVQS